uniref:Uncharacterized protein n=1 Tax=Romanomermis culicivorax TaxID=13658 RepID=A0A915HUW0_ROMCU
MCALKVEIQMYIELEKSYDVTDGYGLSFPIESGFSFRSKVDFQAGRFKLLAIGSVPFRFPSDIWFWREA